MLQVNVLENFLIIHLRLRAIFLADILRVTGQGYLSMPYARNYII